MTEPTFEKITIVDKDTGRHLFTGDKRSTKAQKLLEEEQQFQAPKVRQPNQGEWWNGVDFVEEQATASFMRAHYDAV